MSFEQDIRKWSQEVLDSAHRTHQMMCEEMARLIIQDTPVQTGRARANWQAGLNQASEDVLELIDPSGENAVARVREVLADMKPGDSFVLVNNLPYAGELEDGSSRQAPHGMLKRNLAKWPGLLKKAFQGGGS